MKTHILFYSGGVASARSGFRLVEKHGRENVVWLFCDTKMEDEDIYRFNTDLSKLLSITITTIMDGRDPWEIYRDERLLGNNWKDPCSKILKRELSKRWVKERHKPEECVIHAGYYHDEMQRLETLKVRYFPYSVESPLMWKPHITDREAKQFLIDQGLTLPRLYGLGFTHNNCGGFCCKAGKAHFANLLRTMPCRYAFHEKKEQEIREYLGRDVSILTDKKGGRLTLKMLRERIEKNREDELTEIFEDERSGCGCFAEPDQP